MSKVNSDLATLAAFDMELPVLSDGVTFDTGAADVSKIKLTTGATWTSIANAGDSDIQFQVPSVAGKINDLLLNKKAETVTMTATIDGETYEGEGYNIEPKKVIGGLFMRSEDRHLHEPEPRRARAALRRAGAVKIAGRVSNAALFRRRHPPAEEKMNTKCKKGSAEYSAEPFFLLFTACGSRRRRRARGRDSRHSRHRRSPPRR